MKYLSQFAVVIIILLFNNHRISAQSSHKYNNSLRLQYGLFNYNSTQNNFINFNNDNFRSVGLTFRHQLGRISALNFTGRYYQWVLASGNKLETTAIQSMWVIHAKKVSQSWRVNRITPYIGAGIGYESHTIIKALADSNFTKVYVPLEAGLLFNLSSRVSLGVYAEYKLASFSNINTLIDQPRGGLDIVNSCGITFSYHFSRNKSVVSVPAVFTNPLYFDTSSVIPSKPVIPKIIKEKSPQDTSKSSNASKANNLVSEIDTTQINAKSELVIDSNLVTSDSLTQSATTSTKVNVVNSKADTLIIINKTEKIPSVVDESIISDKSEIVIKNEDQNATINPKEETKPKTEETITSANTSKKSESAINNTSNNEIKSLQNEVLRLERSIQDLDNKINQQASGTKATNPNKQKTATVVNQPDNSNLNNVILQTEIIRLNQELALKNETILLLSNKLQPYNTIDTIMVDSSFIDQTDTVRIINYQRQRTQPFVQQRNNRFPNISNTVITKQPSVNDSITQAINETKIENIAQNQQAFVDELKAIQVQNKLMIAKLEQLNTAPPPEPHKIEKPTINDVVITFNINSSSVSNSFLNDIQKAAIFAIENPNKMILLSGYTDKSGNAAYNLKLSQKRVSAVRNQLINSGIPRMQIVEQYFGSDLASGINNENDRKVVISIR